MNLPRTLKLVFGRLLPALLLLILLMGVAFFLWLRSGGHPFRTGEHTLAGLGEAVQVRFDSRAIPHVEGQSAEDVMAALGYLHANDRMTQMELGRRAAFGRLAERLGETLVEADIEARKLRFDLAAAAIWEASSPAPGGGWRPMPRASTPGFGNAAKTCRREFAWSVARRSPGVPRTAWRLRF